MIVRIAFVVLISSDSFGIHVLSEDGKLLAEIRREDITTEALENALNEHQGEKIIVDNAWILEKVPKNQKTSLEVHHPVLKEWRLNRYEKLLTDVGASIDFADYIEKTRNLAFSRSRESVRKHAEGRDTLVAQAIHAIDELQKSFTLLSGRLREIYALHFPEFTNRVRNPVTMAKIILEAPKRLEMTVELLTSYGIDEEYAQYIVEYKETSLGGEFKDEDLLLIQELADSVYNLYKRKTALEDWVAQTMREVAPNLTAVAGSNVGARLIAHVGSLRDLAFLSSGKVQTLGAEKALYKALRFKGKTPKHGIIFQIPEVGTMPFWLRGKMARAFASKIVIAARLDLYGGSFLGDDLRVELKEKAKKLREQFPNPPKKVTQKPKGKPSFKKNRRRRKK